MALEAGPQSHAEPHKVEVIETEALKEVLIVTNELPIVGGKDYRFVPREYVVGRAMFVWLSCEDKLPLFTFLCNPLTLRWGRFFHDIN